MSDSSLKPPRPVKPASGSVHEVAGGDYSHASTLPRMSNLSFNSGMSELDVANLHQNLHQLPFVFIFLFLQDCSSLAVQTLLVRFKHVAVMMLTPHLVGGKTPTDQKSLCGSDVPPPVPSRTNHSTENLLRDNQVSLVSVGGAPLITMCPLRQKQPNDVESCNVFKLCEPAGLNCLEPASQIRTPAPRLSSTLVFSGLRTWHVIFHVHY